jgi:hypothetical protein
MDARWLSFVRFVRSKVACKHIGIKDLASDGVSDVSLEEYHMSVTTYRGDASSEELGVGCAYIVEAFRSDLITEIGEMSFDATSFNALRDIFWGEDHKGFKGSADHICPRDGILGSAIVDSLDGDSKGMATHFVSWCWTYTVFALLSALKAWADDKHVDASKVFVWMCFFCNNQRKLLIDGDVGDLTETFGERLQKIGQMLILLDTFENPVYTTRVWCIYEAYTATVGGIPIDVALPETSRATFSKILQAKGGFSKITQALTQIDAETAKASVIADEENIKNVIRGTTGFSAVNETVKGALTKWLAYAFEQCLVSAFTSEAEAETEAESVVVGI